MLATLRPMCLGDPQEGAEENVPGDETGEVHGRNPNTRGLVAS